MYVQTLTEDLAEANERADRLDNALDFAAKEWVKESRRADAAEAKVAALEEALLVERAKRWASGRMLASKLARDAVPYPEAGDVDKPDCQGRLCLLAAKVWAHFDPYAQHPCDCFCTSRPLPFRNSGQAIAWIEGVVRRELARTPKGGAR